MYNYTEGRVAIVGMGGIFPEAHNKDIFWENVLSRKVSIREVPDHLIHGEIFYRPDAINKVDKNDKTYTKVAALLDVEDYKVLSKKFRIPPAVALHMDPNQHTAIYCVDQAIQSLHGKLPNERTAVILGNGSPGKCYDNIIRRTNFSKIKEIIRSHRKLNSSFNPLELEEIINDISQDVLRGTIPITEDSAPGMLQNIIAARITNLFDFHGPAYVVDAACASALAACICGVTGLLNGQFDAAIVGAVEATFDENILIIFSAINALSPDGSYPFDTRANGFVMGLGGGVLVLKRLEDALRDKDHIYALISGFGQGSDGKGKHIAAPNEEGQARVIEKACKMAGYPADTIELIEAHGTGTVVGDLSEINALKKAFAKLGVSKEGFCGLGSVKSNIGHLRYAAGVPGLIKAALAIDNKILPPTANIKNVNPRLGLDGSPFYILKEKKPWKEVKAHPRRANVSAYGFGGADYHIAMEEFRPEFLKNSYYISQKSTPLKLSSSKEVSFGKKEVVFFSGASPMELNEAYIRFKEAAGKSEDYEKEVFKHNSNVSARKEWRVAIYAEDIGELDEKWKLLSQFIDEDRQEELDVLNLKGIYIGRGKKAARDKIAWMFPGQASQYPNMLKGLYESYPPIEALYLKADAVWSGKYGENITQLIFGADEAALEERLKDTKNTHPAVFLSDIAMFKLLSESGLTADYMIGHSLGEIAAIYASGMLDMNSSLELLGSRGYSFDSISEENRGRMVSINEASQEVNDIIRSNNLDISISNINSPVQTVVGGKSGEMSKLVELLDKSGISYTPLKVSHAFHTELMTDAAEEFFRKIRDIEFRAPTAKVMACHRGDFYPDTADGLKEMSSLLKEQMTSSVNFSKAVMKLYDLGVRIFVECGPSSILTKLVKSILSGKNVKVVATNHKSKDSVEAYKLALAELFACGVDVSPMPTGRMLGLPQKSWVVEKRVNITESPFSQINTTKPSYEKNPQKESLVYSGVSMGLPGSFKKVFSDENLRLVFDGNNLIERLTDDEMQSLADLNITRLVKDEGATTFKRLSSINDVIQLAAKLGNIDMLNDYLVDEKTLNEMTITWCAGVAAGYEALRDAGIPLVKEVMKTSTGASLPGRLVLPQEMREDTGIIFANGFLSIEPFITEVSKFIAYKLGDRTKGELISFYESVISKVDDLSVRKILTDWFNLHYSRLTCSDNESGVYEFNKDFMAQISSRANNRLAQFIGAMGPNFHISAACSSTVCAVTVAEDLIRGGHAGRVIVIGAENPTSKTALPWIGGSFLSMGAATNSSDVFEAAIPFDNRRSGMIIGAGAVGIVIEKENDVKSRGMNGICRILGTHAFNTAGHQSKVDSTRHSIELNKFMSKMEKEYGFDRTDIARKTVYYSHETYSSRKGGCSHTEKIALEDAFGEAFRDLKIVNTKGITGHTMGASIEEAVAAKSLQYQKIPPVVNFKVPDPELEGLNLSRGGTYDFDYVLRMVSGYGGQGNYQLLQKLASGDARIVNVNVYKKWLEEITASTGVVLNHYGRILVAEGRVVTEGIDKNDSSMKENIKEVSVELLRNDAVLSETDIIDEILNVYSDITKYPKDMLDLSMEIEADLGIDTVKQATIISIIMEKFNIINQNALNMYELKTIKHVVDAVIERQGDSGDIKTFEEKKEEPPLKDLHVEGTNAENSIFLGRVDEDISDREIWQPCEAVEARPGKAAFEIGSRKSDKPEDIEAAVVEIFSEITGYPAEMLEKDMEIEADLGIDTVKQATILSIVSERFSLPDDGITNMSRMKTIGEVIAFVVSSTGSSSLNNESGKDDDNSQMVSADLSLQENDVQQAEKELCLQVPVFVEEKLPSKDYDLKDKSILVIGDCPESVHKVSEYFKKISDKTKEFIFPKEQEGENFDGIISRHLENGPEVLVDCSHVGTKVEFDSLEQSEEKLLLKESENRFVFYKKLLERMPGRKLRILCMVSVDGHFGHGFKDTERKVTDPFYGAVCGFYKGLRKELKDSLIKIVDLDIENAAQISERELIILKDELESRYTDYEIGYFKGIRRVLRIDYVDRAALKSIELPEDSHFVITGGGYGITSEIVKELARVYRGKFTIIGRTVIPENIKELSALDEDSLKNKRHEIQETLVRNGMKVTPVLLKEEWDKLLKAVSIYKLVKEIEDSGSQIAYIACDVTDYESLKEALYKSFERFGPANVLIHGAGIERSRLIAQKSPEEFRSVFSVKADGIINLYRIVDKKSLKTVVGFSSISGMFGNEGQLDYCSANSFIGSFITMVNSINDNVHALSIVWSGWKDTGMVWRNEYVKNNSEEIGLNLIEPQRGSAEFVNVLTHAEGLGEIILSKGLGSFIDKRLMKDCSESSPMIDWVFRKEGKIDKVYKTLYVKKEPIVDQHRTGVVPLMPAVGFMEIAAETHRLCFGSSEQYCFKNIKLMNPLKFFHNKSQEVIVKVEYSEEPGNIEVKCYNNFEFKPGITRLIELNSMSVSDKPGDYEALLELTDIEDQNMDQGFFNEALEIYYHKLDNSIHLGPLFVDRNKENNIYRMNDKGTVYSLKMPEEQITNRGYRLEELLINPAFMDSLYQACGVHTLHKSNWVFLPWEIGEAGVIRVPRSSGNFKVYSKVIIETDEYNTYDAAMFNEAGELCYYAKNVVMRRVGI